MNLDDYCTLGAEGYDTQSKFWLGDTLIKLDTNKREARKEYSAYKIGILFGLPMVAYRVGLYTYNGQKHIGCACKNFLLPNEESISLKVIRDNSIIVKVSEYTSVQGRYQNTVSAAVQYTGLSYGEVVEYLARILVFDFLICNSDRHLNNIEFCKNVKTGVFHPAPIFDNGRSFLQRDRKPTPERLEILLKQYTSYPFSSNPVENLISLKHAKRICNLFVRNAQLNGGLERLNINSWHKSLVKLRIKYLMSL